MDKNLDWYDGFGCKEDVYIYKKIFENRKVKVKILPPRDISWDDWDIFIDHKEYRKKFNIIERIALFFGRYSSEWLIKQEFVDNSDEQEGDCLENE